MQIVMFMDYHEQYSAWERAMLKASSNDEKQNTESPQAAAQNNRPQKEGLYA